MSDWPGSVWFRVHQQTHDFGMASERLRSHFKEATTEANGHTWLALRVPPEVGGAAVGNDLVGQVKEAIDAIGDLETASEFWSDHHNPGPLGRIDLVINQDVDSPR